MRCFSLLALLWVWAPVVSADQFVLTNGNSVEGVLLNEDERPRESYKIRLATGGELTLDASAVKEVVVLSPQQRRYRELLARLPDKAELHWKMAEACAKWSLPKERTFHLEQTIRLDPNHEEARRALKHRQRPDGTWAPVDVIMEEAGRVRRDGRWVTKQEAELADAAEAYQERQIEWKKKIRLWRRWLNDPRRREQALQEIEAIEDSAAVGPLVELFREDKNAALRDLLAEVLGRFSSSAATSALVEASLFAARDLQLQCLRQLEKNGRNAAVQQILPYLHNGNNQLVLRSGYALGVLGDEHVILPLIHALNTTHTRLVGGAGDGRINLRNGGLSAGRTKPKKVQEVEQNREVLSALVKLTNENFGYDERRWLNWYLVRSTPPNLDLRREE